MLLIRSAVESDIRSLCSLDLIARVEKERREFICREVAAGTCFVAVADEEVIGDGVLNYTFYHNGCIDMLYVHTEHRRRGAGAALMRHMERLVVDSIAKVGAERSCHSRHPLSFSSFRNTAQ